MSRPLGSIPTPASRSFTATTGRSAGEPRVGTQCLRFPPRHAPSPDPTARAGVSTLAFSRSVQEPQTRITPPLRRAPPGQYTGTRQAHLGGPEKTPDFDAVCMTYDASTATPDRDTPRPSVSGTSSRSPPDAVKPRLFPVAQHNGLQPMHHRAV